jgi:release factor glutamine methyltransferase
MTLEEILQQTTKTLSKNNIEDAHIEARILLGHRLKKTPSELLTETDLRLTKQELESIEELVEHRLRGEPAAYITNQKEFYGVDFYIDQRVLIPRPETELLVEEAIKFAYRYRKDSVDSTCILTIADIGTGCGNIAVSLALNIPAIKVYAIDISPSALEVAGINCALNNVEEQITLLQGNLLDPITKPVDLVIANLPYIATSELIKLQPEIYYFEPKVALDGGKEGLDLIHQLIRQMTEKISYSHHLLLEIGAYQEQAVTAIVKTYVPFANCNYISDLNGIARVVEINI